MKKIVVSRGSFLTTPLTMLGIGVLVLLFSVFMRTCANRPDLFPYLWWASGFWISVSLVPLCIALWLRRRERHQLLLDRLYEDRVATAPKADWLPCGGCGRRGPLVNGECPDCRH